MLRTSILTAIFALTFFVFSPVLAQQAAPPPQEVPDIEVDDEELTAIARAYVNVQNITEQFKDRVNSADDAEAAKALQQEYTEVANAAIADEGVEIDRYDTVIQVASVDEELRQRLLTEIQDLLDEQGGGGDS